MKGFVFRKVVLIVAVAVTFGSFNAFAVEEVKPSASADVGVFSKYVWRGYELSDDSIVIQPSITTEYKGFSLNLWGNLDTDVDNRGSSSYKSSDLNKTDMTLAYDTSIGNFDLGFGYIYYALENDDTEELYISLGASVVPLAPTLTIYRDINQFTGWYLNLGISHSFELPHEITLDLGGSVGYYYSDDKDFVEFNSNDKYRNFHDGLISVGMTIPLDSYITVSPVIAYSFPLGNEADDLLTDASLSCESDYFFSGITFSIAF